MPEASWKFPGPLVPGTLKRRYQRFLADVRLDTGETVIAHCPNTGSMKTCWVEGSRIWMLHNPGPKRKLHYTWELTETRGGFIGVNTARPNQVVEWAIGAGRVPELAGYGTLRREVRYGKENSRIDLLLESGRSDAPPAYVEIKNTTLLEGDRVLFPDAVTLRGRKHLRELREMVEQGFRAVLFFFVNRPEADCFAPADAIDPEYGKILREVHGAGVEILAYRAQATPEGIGVDRACRLHL